MESIKPDKDEVDAFRNQKVGGKAQAHREQVRAPAEAPVIAPVAAPRSVAEPQVVVGVTRASQVLVLLLVMLLVGMAILFAWQVQNHEDTIAVMEAQLVKAQRNIDQSQLVVARLEGQIFQTDATMAQSGNELAREIKRMDVEQRRQAKQLEALGVQLDSRVKALASEYAQRLGPLEGELARLAGIAGTLDSTRSTVEALEVQARNFGARLDEQAAVGARTEQAVTELTAASAAGRGGAERADAAIQALRKESESFAAALDEVQARLAQLSQGTQATASARSLQELSERVAAIDATRSQLVQRFVTLDRKLNEMSLELQALRARPALP